MRLILCSCYGASMKDKFNNSIGPQIRSKKSSKNIIIPICTIFTLIAGLSSATQYFAYKFEYQAGLGANLNGFYPPWNMLVWLSQWHERFPDMFMQAGSVGILVTGVGLIALMIIKILAKNSAKANEYLHGSARWANKKDIQESGLLGNDEGVYVGAWEDKSGKLHYLRHNGPEHVLTYAPTRSGKGVGLVLPTLLSWPHSAVITDLKGELWAMTAGWRKQHARNKVIRFEPAALKGCVCWNPLDEIRLGTEYEVGDVQNLVTLIVDPDGKGLNDHWQKTSQALLVGLILHLLYKAKNDGVLATLPAVDALLADPNREVSELWFEMTTYGHVNGKNHPVVGFAARDMMDRPEDEAGSVLSTTKSYLSLYRDPVSSEKRQ